MSDPRPVRPPSDDLRRRLDRLDGLPLRPSTARAVLDSDRPDTTRLAEVDPGWALARSRVSGVFDGFALVAASPWWSRPVSLAASEALDRLWKHGVAASRAARRLATEAGAADPDRLARAALVHQLGYWAVAAVDPETLADWLAEPSPTARRALERESLGTDAASLGRDLAERWGADPVVIDAAWLLAGPGESLGPRAAEDPTSWLPLRKSRIWADLSPWAAGTSGRGPGPADPRLRLLRAEVECRCLGPFVADDAPASEERLARSYAALRAKEARRETRDRRRLDAAVEALGDRDDRDDRDADLVKLDALAEFAAGAGHELNNPLAVVLGRAQLLLAKRPDAETTRSLRAIAAAAQRAHRILRDLMAVARPPTPRPRPCLVDEVVRNCLRDLRDEAEARGVRLVAETRDPGPRAWVDPDPLRHLADVLVRNAIEATPPGGTVRFQVGGDSQTLIWSVRDEGPGLDPAAAAHLFDPFYCGRQAGRGLGLGLPRASRLVSRAGGTLRWDPAPAPTPGTIFRLHLPLPPEPPPANVA